MIPANEKDLENLMEDYTKFRNLGNGEMKAAYLAASGRGFTEIVKSNKTDILLMRETDKKFIVFSYSIEKTQPENIERKSIVKFHNDANRFVGY
jgi:hypothetical protein